MIPLLIFWSSLLPLGYDFEGHLETIGDFQYMDIFPYGSMGAPSQNYAEFEKLRKRATLVQLLSAKDHANPMIRAYIHRALSKRYPIKWIPIAIGNMKDQETIEIQSACSASRPKLGELYEQWLTKLLDSLIIEGDILVDSAIHPLELKYKVLDFLFSQKYPGTHLVHILMTWSLPDAYYENVRQLTHINQREAFVALARFQKPQDTALIRNYLVKSLHEQDQTRFALKAAVLFPDASYHDILEKKHLQSLTSRDDPESQTLLYLALLTSQHPTTPAMMVSTIQAAQAGQVSPFQLHRIYDALSSDAALDIGLYEDVLFELWMSAGILHPDHFEQLWQRDRPRCIQTLEFLLHEGAPMNASLGRAYSFTQVALALKATGEPSHFQLLNDMIPTIPIREIPTILPEILALNNSATLPFLLERLEKTTHPTVIEWMILGIRHLKPQSYKTIVKTLIDRHPAWAETTHQLQKSKKAWLRHYLRKAKPLSKVIAKRKKRQEKVRTMNY